MLSEDAVTGLASKIGVTCVPACMAHALMVHGLNMYPTFKATVLVG
jgi:hypothetical protein